MDVDCKTRARSAFLATMEFLDYGHNLWLVASSLVIALVAGGTGLSLTKDLSRKTVTQRKLAVALAAIALGGGIWSMHFIAMLGLRLPILFYYDAAITLSSALIAILMVALALTLLHFTRRTRSVVAAAGAIVGFGVLAMHYVGMAGMQLCRAVYTIPGVAGASVLAICLCTVAFAVAYGDRSNRGILIGTICFAVAVFAAHFLAMAGTGFVATTEIKEFGPLISNEIMAIGVILSSFLIFGAFLWVGVTYLTPPEENVAQAPDDQPSETADAPKIVRIPCDRDGGKVFVASGDVAYVRADGHYTQVYTDEGRLFCAWPITEASKRLTPGGFIKVHRSYLVNPSRVSGFERSKDKGKCTFATRALPPVPVSRSHLKDAQAALG